MLRKYLRTLYLFKEEKADRDAPDYYPGQEAREVYSHRIEGNVQPAKNAVTSEIYGERVTDILSLICEKDAEINKDMKVSLSGSEKPEYKITSIEEYTRHKVIMMEAIL